jgi:uncharacterized protein YbjQ (UPF0145 family)
MDAIIGLVIFLVMLAVGYFAGVTIEKKHFRELVERERKLLHIPVVAMKTVDVDCDVESARFVCGNVVVSVDYFKRFLANLRNLVGGEIKSYSPLLDRARREALMRMKEQAPDADVILNVRFETCSIGAGEAAGNKNPLTCVEFFAYGTAIKLRKQAQAAA